MTGVQAAEILGVGYSAVPKLVARGDLHSRPGRHSRSEPSLDRSEVEQLAALRRHEREQMRARQADVLARRRGYRQPPDDVHEWLTTTQAGELLGITKQAVHHRLQRETLPFTWSGGVRWVRRDLLEMVVRARAAQERARQL